MMDTESGRAPTGQAGRASHGASKLSPPSGDHPSRIRDWADERIAWHKSERDEYRRLGETTGAAMAVEAMLELMELKSFLSREYGIPLIASGMETRQGGNEVPSRSDDSPTGEAGDAQGTSP